MSQHHEGPPSEPSPDPVPRASQRRFRGVRATTAAAAALGLAVTGGAVAGAAALSSTVSTPASQSQSGPAQGPGDGPGSGQRPAAVGTVRSTGTNTFTLTTPQGTVVTVDVSSTTTYRDHAATSASLADVTVGAHVAVFGITSSGTVTATSVAIGPPPGGPGDGPGSGQRPAAVGTVRSTGTNTFTLTTPQGTVVTVDVSSTTTYRDHAATSASLADVTVGAHVAVFGTTSSGTVTATSVAIGPPPGGPGDGPGSGQRPAAVGTVRSTGTNTFTLTTPQGTVVTVDVSSTTTYRDHAATSPSLADVTVGAHVAVFGTTSSGTVTATSVAIGPPPGGPGDGPGSGMGPGMAPASDSAAA